MSIMELVECMQYSYISLAKAVQNLELLGLVKTTRGYDRVKRISFVEEGVKLWELAKPFMRSPVKTVLYCDALPNISYAAAGLTALSEYTNLADDDAYTIAIYTEDFNEDMFQGLNRFDGQYILEIWRYPTLSNEIVDKLSLYLSLEDSLDPRVHKENELMFEDIWK